MDKKTIVLVIIIFILLIAGMFGYAFLKKSEIKLESEPTVTEDQVLPYADILRIEAKQFFSENQHTFVGEIILPTPCDLLEVNSIVRESFPEQIVLEFNVINNSTNCLAKETAQRFSVTAAASGEATVSAMFMGRAVELNLIPAAEGESPEEFELFIKG